MRKENIQVTGFLLQENPPIYSASIPGNWLLMHTTPSWRIKDPKQGFQRVVKEDRAKEIAVRVLDQHRTFPNSIVLATDIPLLTISNCSLVLPENIRFLVVDGQHRLWAQTYSQFNAEYSCIIHSGLSEIDMAQLFLEINDTQRRVPSSLRWDLIRLVRPNDDLPAIAASDMIFLLTTDESSPLFQRIDRTGEVKELSLKQGSLAPELKSFASRKLIKELAFDQQYSIVFNYIFALRENDRDNWISGESPFFQARVLRCLLRLLPEIVTHINKDPKILMYTDFESYINKIDKTKITSEAIKAIQGSAGMKAIYEIIKAMIFG
jgi:DGQHR domain-containing protein